MVDGFSTEIASSCQELRVRVLVHPSSIDLSSRTLRWLVGHLAARRGEAGTRWRLTAGRQALLALAHLRCGDTYARLAAGFGISTTAAYRSVREAVEVLAALAPTLAKTVPASTGSRRPSRAGVVLAPPRMRAVG